MNARYKRSNPAGPKFGSRASAFFSPRCRAVAAGRVLRRSGFGLSLSHQRRLAKISGYPWLLLTPAAAIALHKLGMSNPAIPVSDITHLWHQLCYSNSHGIGNPRPHPSPALCSVPVSCDSLAALAPRPANYRNSQPSRVWTLNSSKAFKRFQSASNLFKAKN